MNTIARLPQPETIKVSALHAYAYCPRLFYLEEVEALYIQDAAVFAGRRFVWGWRGSWWFVGGGLFVDVSAVD
jgi:hypothetical protein